ncbi:MFS transporter [Candidatus Pelagibacter sp.]|jgi:MFS family permease|nr:MFS transporter [Candidatus Pelagibacter sp.]MDB3886256.1 MFS transporter [Candidatus Pelagibacter sp.]MDB3904001.1 MFS transporter [Candidatus Pelagibacter sp.]MDC1030701.1 MFS transporter [Candidatus Pelagibacter sp.]
MSPDKFIKNKTVLITLISACLIVIISLGIRQTFGMFYFDFSTDLGITLSQFGFALGLQMFLWGAFAPWFGVITDKYGGHIAVFIGFVFYLLGILMLVSEYNTGLYFVTGIGVLIGVALGGTAISIPVSVVAKHFPQSNRTAAIGIVTAAGSFGYFVSPVFTRYSLVEFGWESTLLIFAVFIFAGLLLAFYLTTPKDVVGGIVDDKQTASEALQEAFKSKSFIYLTLGFFVCGWHIALVATHIPIYINDRGLPEWCTVTILSMIGLFNIAGTLTSGYLAQKLSKKLILSTIYLARGLVIALFIFLPPSPIIAVLFGVMFGFLWLSTVPPTMGLVGFIFGTKYIGLLYGIVFLSHQVGSFLGAYLGGVFHDLYGSYDYAWYISIALSIFAGLIHLPIIEKQVARLQTT